MATIRRRMRRRNTPLDLCDSVRSAAPAIEIHSEFLPARLAIRLNCGARAAALEAELLAVQTKCELAAMETMEAAMRVAGGMRE